MRKHLLAVNAALLLTACTPQAGNGPDPTTLPLPAPGATVRTIETKSPLVVGVKVDQEGTGYLDVATYRYSGFDVDLAREMSKRLFDVDEPYFLPVSSDTREKTLAAGAVSFFVATYTMNAARSANHQLAGPYLITRQGVMVKAGRTDITSIADLDDKTVCVVGGGSLSAEQFEKAVSGAKATALGSYSDCLRNLRDGRYDAFSTDLAILYGYAPKNSGLTVVKDLVIGSPIFYGIAFRPDDGELCRRTRDQLKTIVGPGGSWASIFQANLSAYANANPDYLTQVKPSATQIDDNSCRTP